MKKKRTILLVIMLMAVGFASVTTTLILNGTLNFAVSDDFDVIFTSAKLNGVNHNEVITNDKKTINFITNELMKISDEETLTYKVANRSKNYDANVSITCESINNEYVDITLPSETRVLAGEERTGSIIVRLIKASESDQEINLTCTLNAEAIERDTLGDDYIEPFSKAGTLRSVVGVIDTNDFWKYKENITKVVFENKMNVHEVEESHIYDVSENKDGSVMAYLEKNEETLSITEGLETTQAYTVYIQSETGVKGNNDSAFLFYEFSNLKTIEGLEYFDTRNVTTMRAMFHSCKSLTNLDLSNFDTSQVTNMNGMFAGCSNLTTLNISKLATSQVTNMISMFSNCQNLTSLDLSSFDTRNVTEMMGLFAGCSNLTTLDISNFDTSQVTDMGSMFADCSNLTTLDISNFDTSKVTNMYRMFNTCKSLINLDLSFFDTSNVTNMSNMFSFCENLISLDLSSFDTSKVTDLESMFENCSKLSTTITIRGNNYKDYDYMFKLAATEEDAQIMVNYTNDTSSLVDTMIARKPSTSNVVKGNLVA